MQHNRNINKMEDGKMSTVSGNEAVTNGVNIQELWNTLNTRMEMVRAKDSSFKERLAFVIGHANGASATIQKGVAALANAFKEERNDAGSWKMYASEAARYFSDAASKQSYDTQFAIHAYMIAYAMHPEAKMSEQFKSAADTVADSSMALGSITRDVQEMLNGAMPRYVS
jgi:hypothetical protein